MGINLQKGQKIDLTKNGGAGLRSVMVGLGWDEAPRRGGLFSQPQPIDCDASAILCGANGKLVNTGNINDAVVSVIFVILAVLFSIWVIILPVLVTETTSRLWSISRPFRHT